VPSGSSDLLIASATAVRRDDQQPYHE
jgi:hypothetical protein